MIKIVRHLGKMNSTYEVIYKKRFMAPRDLLSCTSGWKKGLKRPKLNYAHASTVAGLALRRYRRKLNFRFMRPHHALIFSSLIFIVIFQPMDMVMQPKTCSTQALIGDLIRLRSLAASLSGWLWLPYSWMQLSKPPRFSKPSKHSPA